MFTVMKASDAPFNPRQQIAELFANGFMQWLTFFSKDKDVIAQAFAHMFILEQFYVAIDGDKVAGTMGCSDGYASSVRLDKRELRKHLGFIKGTFASMFLKSWEGGVENPMTGKGSIEFVGTSADYRRRGVSTMIFEYILENAPYTEYVISEVADTNTSAMNLYRKWGFTEYKSKPVPKNSVKKIGINRFVSLELKRDAGEA
jgi:ribosomal protein S18 acetylase RimI-like enzyme